MSIQTIVSHYLSTSGGIFYWRVVTNRQRTLNHTFTSRYFKVIHDLTTWESNRLPGGPPGIDSFHDGSPQAKRVVPNRFHVHSQSSMASAEIEFKASSMSFYWQPLKCLHLRRSKICKSKISFSSRELESGLQYCSPTVSVIFDNYARSSTHAFW